HIHCDASLVFAPEIACEIDSGAHLLYPSPRPGEQEVRPCHQLYLPGVPDVVLGMWGREAGDIAEEERMRSTTQGLIIGTMCLFSTHVFTQGALGQTRTPDASAQQLRRDLELMKEQMRQ